MGLPRRAVAGQQTDPRDRRGGRGTSPWVDRLVEALVLGEVFLEDSRMLLALEPSVGTPEMCSQLHYGQLPPLLSSGGPRNLGSSVWGVGVWLEALTCWGLLFELEL